MIVRCLANRGTGLGEPDHGLYFTDAAKFSLVVGKDYPAHGMAMYKRGLIVLVQAETGSPKWYPVELFEVVDGTLPADWRFATRDEGATGTQAIWGYPELVDDPGHKDALIEREPDALAVFADRVAAAAGQ